MPAQHQQHMKEQEANGKMEIRRQEPISEGEGANTGKPPAKEPPSVPQHSGKKKVRKKKKKKKKKAVQGNGKHSSKSNKRPVFAVSPLELLQPQSNEGTPQDAEAARVTPGQMAGKPPLASTSAISSLTQGNSGPTNESLRWDGILDDPIAEEERLWHYRLNRRKRYGAYIQQNLPPEPSFALKHLPQLCKAAQMNGERLLCKSKSSTTTSEANKNQSRLNSKTLTKVPRRHSALIPSISQEVL